MSDALIGIEYAKDCWVFRLVGERTISNSTNTANNSIYFQLELKGLGSLQNDNPASTLTDGIAGYEAVKFVDAEPETPIKNNLNDR